MIIVTASRPPKEGSKTQNGRFPCKVTLRLTKYATKFLCENCQRQSCKAFIGLTIRAKMIGEDVHGPLLHENLANTDSPSCTMPIFNLFSLVAPQP